ncbi:MAG TPA: aminopeptidase N [Burkholderiales bacterium]|nr:aminopeptidase N [Burkholderiales bacterium]
MAETAHRTIHFEDYAPPAFLIETADLDFDLYEEHALVTARLDVTRNPKAPADAEAPLALDGDELELVSVSIDGRTLSAGDYVLDAEHLTIARVPGRFRLETVCRIDPRGNTKLMGLYGSKDGFFTQCEAEGFRRITYFIDRPDVMARYSTTIRAERERYPVLLSNGNLVAQGDGSPPPGPWQGANIAPRPASAGGQGARHWARWEDPFPKPSYLFALVAAKLDKLEDTFVTRSGRKVRLAIYVEPGKLDQCGFAMQALKKAMKWDEQVFGLEVDLDCYMIVAVGDFNMGAMENKGLNVFNTKYVLARPDLATDTDYMNIDRVVAHEYFHNWTGNRVTCRDWFQLSLKEGLTVFRDQEFGADHYSRPVQRIQEVRALRAAQFPEDAGPMAHPVRPASYIEISNFYTATVYEKGAEVVRMIHTLIGAEGFRKGMDLYFKRHDGQAVTTDDFVQAMQDASGVDLSQFRRWYDQAGTPVVEVSGAYDAQAGSYALDVRQSCAPTAYETRSGITQKQPYHIPLALALVGPDGADLPLRLRGETRPAGSTRVLSVTQPEQRFVFEDVPVKPVPSLARNLSAPVIVRHDYGERELTHLMAHDSDPFNRWEAGQRLALDIMLRGIADLRAGRAPHTPEAFIDAFGRVLADAGSDPAFAAEAMALPSETYVAEQLEVVDPDAVHQVRLGMRKALAGALREALHAAYDAHATRSAYSPDAVAAGRRALRNACLGYLAELPGMTRLAFEQFDTADNMTDAMAALSTLAQFDCPERTQALERFYSRWSGEPLVLDKWFAVQATSRLPAALAEVKRLTAHPAFTLSNPNKVRALIGSFCHGNPARFHSADGAGYAFAAEQIVALDRLNPQVAARLTRSFDRWKKFDSGRQSHARAALERIRGADKLSKDVLEVVDRALA